MSANDSRTKSSGFDRSQYLDIYPICSTLIAEIGREFINSWTEEEAGRSRDKYVNRLVANGYSKADAEVAWHLIVRDDVKASAEDGIQNSSSSSESCVANPPLLSMAIRNFHNAVPAVNHLTTLNENVFCFEGGRWVVRFKNQTIYPQDISGIKYLHYLISRPEKTFSPKELYDGFGGRAKKQPRAMTVSEAVHSRLGFAPAQSDVLIDKRGRGEMLRRLENIETEMAKAKLIPNADLIERLATERIGIKEQLRKAFTPVGSRRIQEPDLVRRMKAVDIAIRRAKEKIQRAGHQSLLDHLNESIEVKVKSGCVYVPNQSTSWRTQSVQFVAPGNPR